MEQKRRLKRPWWKGQGANAKRRGRADRRKQCASRGRYGFGKSPPPREEQEPVVVEVPSVLVPQTNHDEIGRFLSDLDGLARPGVKHGGVSAMGLRSADVAGMLLLSARMQTLADTGKYGRGKDGWSLKADWSTTPPSIARMLNDFGAYGFRRVGDGHTSTRDGIRVLRVRRGREAEGRTPRELVEVGIRKLTGDEAPDSKLLQMALTEAAINAREHGYGKDSLGQHWWMAASYNPETGLLHVAIYDGGVGVPATIRRKAVNGALTLVPDALERVLSSDAKAIAQAHKMGVSRTREPHRGSGMPWMQSYIDGSETHRRKRVGTYRVTSGRGVYEVAHHPDGTTASTPKDMGAKIPGTLVEWIVNMKEQKPENDT